MIKVYPAIFHKEDGYWVEFPDLPGCQSCGDTLEQTMEFASEALGLYLADLLEQDKEFPEATPIKEIKKAKNDVVSYIATDVNKYRRNTKAVKKTLSIPAWRTSSRLSRNSSSVSPGKPTMMSLEIP